MSDANGGRDEETATFGSGQVTYDEEIEGGDGDEGQERIDGRISPWPQARCQRVAPYAALTPITVRTLLHLHLGEEEMSVYCCHQVEQPCHDLDIVQTRQAVPCNFGQSTLNSWLLINGLFERATINYGPIQCSLVYAASYRY